MTTAIVALDPGQTTGVATWYKGHFIVHQDTYTPAALHRHLSLRDPTTVVYESFVYITGLPHADLTPVELIGVIKLYAEETGCGLRSYTPYIGKAFWTDDKIKAIGQWQKGMRHGMDALKHLLKYLTEEEKNPTWIDALRQEARDEL